MIVTGNIKKIMYMGKEISKIKTIEKREDKYIIFTVWEQQTVPPPPPPKPCTSAYQCHQCGVCERSNQCTYQKSGQSCGQDCGNCLSLCQNNQGSDS